MASAEVIKLPEGQMDFCYLHEPRKSDEEGGKDSWECVGIYTPKEADLSELKRIINDAKMAKWPNFGKKINKKTGKPVKEQFLSPIRPGKEYDEDSCPNGFDLDKYPHFEGKWIVAMKSKGRPVGLSKPNPKRAKDGKMTTPCEEGDMYNGCFFKATVKAFAYEYRGKKGVTLILQNVFKTRDGDPIIHGRSAEGDFGDEDMDEWEAKNSQEFDDEDNDLLDDEDEDEDDVPHRKVGTKKKVGTKPKRRR